MQDNGDSGGDYDIYGFDMSVELEVDDATAKDKLAQVRLVFNVETRGYMYEFSANKCLYIWKHQWAELLDEDSRPRSVLFDGACRFFDVYGQARGKCHGQIEIEFSKNCADIRCVERNGNSNVCLHFNEVDICKKFKAVYREAFQLLEKHNLFDVDPFRRKNQTCVIDVL